MFMCFLFLCIESGLASFLGLFSIPSDKISLDHDKSCSISQLIKGKLRDLQKLLKYFNGAKTSLSNALLLIGTHPILFFFYTQNIYFLLSFHYAPIIIIFLCIITHFIHNNSTNFLMPWNNCHYTVRRKIICKIKM